MPPRFLSSWAKLNLRCAVVAVVDGVKLDIGLEQGKHRVYYRMSGLMMLVDDAAQIRMSPILGMQYRRPAHVNENGFTACACRPPKGFRQHTNTHRRKTSPRSNCCASASVSVLVRCCMHQCQMPMDVDRLQ